MSLQPGLIAPVPEYTAQVARAAFPDGNPYLQLRDQLGTLFTDADFADLYPRRGQPALGASPLCAVKGGVSQWVQVPPGQLSRSGRKLSERRRR